MDSSHSFKFAMAAAGLLLASCSKTSEPAPATAANESQPAAQVKCLGVNECKGQGQCGGPSGNVCAGQNDCRGKGWILLDQKTCTDKGGSEYKG